MLLSYKKWQKLNENFGVNLGVKTPAKIANLHSRWDEMGLDLPMMMKKKSKKMFGDGPEAGAGPDDSGGDAPPFAKKGKKKKPPFGGGGDEGPDDLGGPAPDDEGGDELDLDADMDGDDLGDGPPDADDDGGDAPAPDMGGDMGDDMGDDDADIDLGDGDDDVGDLDDEGDDDGPAPGAGGPDGPAADGPAPKKGGSFIDKTKQVADGAKMMHKGASKMIKGMKESTGVKKKMTKEESEFWRSLQAQTGATKFAKDEGGVWTPVQEDAVIAPSDPNAEIIEEEPAPGQPGFAPQGRVGSGIGSFTEWAQKYKRKTKINESKKHKK